MRQAFIKLHVSILLAGFTGIFGKIITLNEGLLVWYRILFALLILLALQPPTPPKGGFRKFFKLPFGGRGGAERGAWGVGSLLALHWVFFFGSIKASNVSIGVVCFSLTGFFTAILEPLMNRRRISLREIGYSLVAVAGILLIFHFDARYRTGILLGIASALLAALFTITNKKLGTERPLSAVLFHEMAGGLLCLTLLMPFYLWFFPVETVVPGGRDLVYLLIFSAVFTVGLYLLQIDALRTISAFTVNLSYNLEPVYSILIAILFLGENEELRPVFYAGLSLILLSVALQSHTAYRQHRVSHKA